VVRTVTEIVAEDTNEPTLPSVIYAQYLHQQVKHADFSNKKARLVNDSFKKIQNRNKNKGLG
jgi:hypothetical protein